VIVDRDAIRIRIPRIFLQGQRLRWPHLDRWRLLLLGAALVGALVAQLFSVLVAQLFSVLVAQLFSVLGDAGGVLSLEFLPEAPFLVALDVIPHAFRRIRDGELQLLDSRT
jgi:hypothetical protein